MLVPLGINLSGGEIESTNAALNAPPDKTRQLSLASTSLKRSTGALHAYGTGCRACHAGNHGFDPRTLRQSSRSPRPRTAPRGPPWRAVEKWLTHLAHTQEIGGSNPPCATTHRDPTGSRVRHLSSVGVSSGPACRMIVSGGDDQAANAAEHLRPQGGALRSPENSGS